MKSMMFVKAYLQLFYVLAQLRNALGGGNLEVKFIYFNSTSDKLNDFKNLCDINLLGELESHCDPVFHIEIIRDGAFGKSLFSYQQHDLRLYENMVEINFTSKIDRMENPLKNAIEMEVPGNVYLVVRVEDNDDQLNNDVMDIFVKQLDYAARNFTLVDFFNPRSEHRLKVEYRYVCDMNYYGIVCSRHCEGQNNAVKGYYDCTAEGHKRCLTGWKSPNLDCKVPDWCRWC